MIQGLQARIRIYEDSNFGKSPRRFYEDRLRSGRVTTAAGLTLDLAVIADGIGGENAGERAAEMTVDEVFAYAKSSHDQDIPLLLQTALEFANAKVYLEAQHDRHKQDMGTTAAVAAIHNGRLYIANIGDSRIYLIRGKKIHQLTRDHTWGNEMVLQGKLSPHEASRHIRRDELMRSIGYEPQILVDAGFYVDGSLGEPKTLQQHGLPLRAGDKVLLCSDGLIKSRRGAPGYFVEAEEIVQILTSSPPGEGAKLLVDKALERNTDDNVSVVVLDVPPRVQWIYFPPHARAAFVAVLGLGFILLATLIPSLQRPPVPPTLPPVEISQDQAYISRVKDTTLQFLPMDGQARSATDGEFIDFLTGAILRTGQGNDGYVFIGLPGRAELFIAPDSEIRFISSDETGVEIQLKAGRAVVRLQKDFPQDRRLTIFSNDWAKTWISGSSMCLWYEPQKQIFNLDCIEDQCGYEHKGESFVQAGYHVEFDGAKMSSMVPALHPEVCDFVPGLVPTLTPTVTPTMTKAPSQTPVRIVAASRTRKPFLPPASTSTPIPTRTALPTRTPLPPSATATNTILPTNTPTLVPTITSTPTLPPTDSPTPQPTNTYTPTPETPSPTPGPTLTATGLISGVMSTIP